MDAEREEIGLEYDYEFIRKNPIASICLECKRCENINAPSLDNVCCFWCGPRKQSTLRPVDVLSYRERLKSLWRYVVPRQIALF